MTIGLPRAGLLNQPTMPSLFNGLEPIFAALDDPTGSLMFQSLLDDPSPTPRPTAPAEAFNALGVFGRFGGAHGEARSETRPAENAAPLTAATPLASSPQPGFPPIEPVGESAPIIAARSGRSPVGSARPSTRSSSPVEAEPQTSLPESSTAILSPETTDDPEAAELRSKDAPVLKHSPDPQPVSAAVWQDGASLQIALRSTDLSLEHRLTIRRRVDELAGELGLSVDDIHLNGVALPTISSLQGMPHGRRTG